MKTKELLKLSEVAEMLAVSQSTVLRLVWRRELPVVGIGKRSVRVRKSDVEKLIEKGVRS